MAVLTDVQHITRAVPGSCRLVLLGLVLTLGASYPALANDHRANKGMNSYSMADKGPFEGKSFSPHYLIFLNLPGVSARPPSEARFALGLSTYLSQEFLASYEWQEEDSVVVRHSDFENLSLEANARWYPGPRLQLGATMRLFSYGGGILDKPIDAFHELFGFPDAGREYHPSNELLVDYSSMEEYHFLLDRPRISLGDLDLWVVGTPFDTPIISLAFFGGIKLPTGSFEALSGSGGTDLALAVLLDLRLHRRFSVYLNNGITIALTEPNANPDTRTAFGQTIIALEYALNDSQSLLLQANLKDPSMQSDIITMNNLGLTGDQLSFPQTNIKFGMRKRSGAFLFQAYMEEDAFTNNGVDFTLNFGMTKFIP